MSHPGEHPLSGTEEFVVIFDESEKNDNIKLRKVPDAEEFYIGVFLIMRRDQWLISDIIFYAMENVMREACNCGDAEIKSGIFARKRFVRGLASLDG